MHVKFICASALALALLGACGDGDGSGPADGAVPDEPPARQHQAALYYIQPLEGFFEETTGWSPEEPRWPAEAKDGGWEYTGQLVTVTFNLFNRSIHLLDTEHWTVYVHGKTDDGWVVGLLPTRIGDWNLPSGDNMDRSITAIVPAGIDSVRYTIIFENRDIEAAVGVLAASVGAAQYTRGE